MAVGSRRDLRFVTVTAFLRSGYVFIIDQAGDRFAASASARWYDFHPGHHPVCQRQSRAIRDWGFFSARARRRQVSQACFFVSIGVLSRNIIVSRNSLACL
ncbi:MAG: hypothetical protein ACRD3Q_18725 [Terriglobales bacterium]